ncbi:MAG: hypothetical protein CMD39_07240 [Gammaproteobacteria bacterium]|nr:hypothetical protein [Gammaproteobacteria bacterium]
MAIDGLTEFCTRVCENQPRDLESDERLPCYLRIRVGRKQSRSNVVASSIKLTTSTDPGTLYTELEQRLRSVTDCGEPRAYIEALVRSESTPWDSHTVRLEGIEDDDGPDGSTMEKANAWAVVKLVEAVLNAAERSGSQASAAQARAFKFMEEREKLAVELVKAQLEGKAGDRQTEMIVESVKALSPVASVVTAKMLGMPIAGAIAGPVAGAAGGDDQAEGQVDDLTDEEAAAALAEEIRDLVAELPENKRAELLARLNAESAA